MHTCPPFHLAIPVTDLEQAKAFYGQLLGCSMGRFSQDWIDWNLFGHQLVTHRVDAMPYSTAFNPVDGHGVPVPHFGVVIDRDSWNDLAQRLEQAGIEFIIAPYVRFAGQTGEQATMFFCDPAGNALEFKSFADPAQLFAR